MAKPGYRGGGLIEPSNSLDNHAPVSQSKAEPSTSELHFLNPLNNHQARMPRPQWLQQSGYHVVVDLRKSPTVLHWKLLLLV